MKDLKTKLLSRIPAEVIETAEKLDCELYAVGGCIRNILIDREFGDIDFAVVGDAVALAQEISVRIQSKKIAVYKRFGTALVGTKMGDLEFATSRSESYQSDSRKPVDLIPVDIEDDLCRRDFTVNALAYGLTGKKKDQLLDLFSGQQDLNDKIIRTPLDPDTTFSDDPLRMLRAVRFAAELGFDISAETFDGIRNNAGRLSIIAGERIRDEFVKMISGSDPVRAMQLLIDTNLIKEFLPEIVDMQGVDQIGKFHHKDVLKHSLQVMQNVVDTSTDPILRLAALLHDVGKPATKRFFKDQGWTFHGHEMIGAKLSWKIGRRLKLGKEKTARMSKLISLHMRPVNLTSEGVSDSAIRRLMFDCENDIDAQLTLCRADITTANPKLVDHYLSNFEEVQHRMGNVEARDKMRNFNSPVRGSEIIEICQIKPGPIVGAIKGRIEDAILDGIIANDYESAKEYMLKIKDDVISTNIEALEEERRKRSQERRKITSNYKFPE